MFKIDDYVCTKCHLVNTLWINNEWITEAQRESARERESSSESTDLIVIIIRQWGLLSPTQSIQSTVIMNITTTDMSVITLDPAYGYVFLVLILSYFLSFWQGFMVGRMRTRLKVDYPAMYSDTEPLFNCYQVTNSENIIRSLNQFFREHIRTPWRRCHSSSSYCWLLDCSMPR